MSLISVVLLCCCIGNESLTEAEFVLACFEGDLGKIVSAAKERNLDVQVRIVDSSNGRIRNSDSWTALTAAIVGKQWLIASFLIGAGADVNQTTSSGYHPIWLLAEHGNGNPDALTVTTLVLESGGRIDVCPRKTTDSFGIETALQRAVARLDVQMAKLLVSKGASLDSEINNEDSIQSVFTGRFKEIELMRSEVPRLVSDDYWEAANNMRLFLQKQEAPNGDRSK